MLWDCYGTADEHADDHGGWEAGAAAVAETLIPLLQTTGLATIAAAAGKFTAAAGDDEPLYVVTGELGGELADGELEPDFTLGELRAACAALAGAPAPRRPDTQPSHGPTPQRTDARASRSGR